MVRVRIVIVFLFFFCEGMFDSSKISLQCNGDFCFPRVIWSHWGDDIFPEDVEEMITVSRKSLEKKNFTYCLLTPKNLPDFLDLLTFPRGFYAGKVNVKSDYIRVCLLQKYGGIYVDSTMYITSGDEMERVFTRAVNAKRALFGYEKNFIGIYLIESCFLGAPRDSVFMRRYKNEFDTVLNGDLYQYLITSCQSLRSVFDKSQLEGLFWEWTECENPYFLIDHVFLMASLKYAGSEDVLVLPSKDGPFTLVYDCGRVVECFVNHLRYNQTARAMPFIKVPRPYRDGKKFNMEKKEECTNT